VTRQRPGIAQYPWPDGQRFSLNLATTTKSKSPFAFRPNWRSKETIVNIQVNLPSSIAGTSLAAARGGESDAQAAHASLQQSSTEKPAGKPTDSNPIDAGDHTSDRDGHGQQVLDVFERSKRRKSESSPQESEEPSTAHPTAEQSGTGSHLDFQA
jgi:hypothetical protein